MRNLVEKRVDQREMDEQHIGFVICFNQLDYDSFFFSSFFHEQAVLLSVWLQREKEILQKPEQATVNLHTLLITLSNMKGLC